MVDNFFDETDCYLLLNGFKSPFPFTITTV